LSQPQCCPGTWTLPWYVQSTDASHTTYHEIATLKQNSFSQAGHSLARRKNATIHLMMLIMITVMLMMLTMMMVMMVMRAMMTITADEDEG